MHRPGGGKLHSMTQDGGKMHRLGVTNKGATSTSA
jgi:hypothetical protein